MIKQCKCNLTNFKKKGRSEGIILRWTPCICAYIQHPSEKQNYWRLCCRQIGTGRYLFWLQVIFAAVIYLLAFNDELGIRWLQNSSTGEGTSYSHIYLKNGRNVL